MLFRSSRFPPASATTPSSRRISVSHQAWPPFSRSYGGNLPNSLTVVHPTASVSSTRPPVSVSGTGHEHTSLEAFLGSTDSPASPQRLRITSHPHRTRISLCPGLQAYTSTTTRWLWLSPCVTPSLGHYTFRSHPNTQHFSEKKHQPPVMVSLQRSTMGA